LPQIRLKNAALNYQLTGPESAPVLVFSHSLGVNLNMWDPQAESLSLKYRILRYDMRGHGASSIPPGPYTAGQLANDVIDLLDALKIDKVNFCGLSIGGVTGQWLGVHAPSRLNKLILSNIAAKIGTDEIWNKRIADVNANGLESIADGVLQRWFTPAFAASNAPVISRFRQMFLATTSAGYTASCAAIRDFDFREAVTAIRTPTCIIAGSHDPVSSIEDARFLQSSISNSQLVTLPAAHISSTEAADLFNAAVSNFLG
jgi:3-oxoadipate enol-lactonase